MSTHTTTFGPAYSAHKRRRSLLCQMERVRNYLLAAAIRNHWHTLGEIRKALESDYCVPFPEASLSAHLRHLRKKRFGSYDVEKRRRRNGHVWEYHLRAPVA